MDEIEKMFADGDVLKEILKDPETIIQFYKKHMQVINSGTKTFIKQVENIIDILPSEQGVDLADKASVMIGNAMYLGYRIKEKELKGGKK